VPRAIAPTTADQVASRVISAPAPGPLYIAPYEGETPCEVTVVFDDMGHITIVGERPEHRDVDGILWHPWHGEPSGPLQWSQHYPDRQRMVMERPHRCGGCTGEPDRDERGMLWLLNADQLAKKHLTFPRDILTATPAMCRECAERSLRACRVLQAGYITLRVPETELIGVRGTLYSRTSPPQENQLVRFDDDAIHRVIARQLLLELRNAELDEDTLPPPSHGGRAPTAVPGPVWGWQ
jgi:hypothetical protein